MAVTRNFISLLLVPGFLVSVSHCAEKLWGYEYENGPKFWGKIPGTEKCAGNRQSPINIDPFDAEYSKKLGWIKTYNYDTTNASWVLSNNGYSAVMQADFTKDKRPNFEQGLLAQKYYLLQFHLHWGTDRNPGSEHLFNGRRYAAELHLVHVREDLLDVVLKEGLGAIKDDPTSLSVIGIFLDVGKIENTYYTPLTDSLQYVTKSGTSKVIKNINLHDLVDEELLDHEPYFFYEGSLTNPGCYEIVLWNVMQEPVQIGVEQVLKLQQLLDPKGVPIDHNFRGALNKGKRVVLTNVDLNSASYLSGSVLVFLCCVLAFVFN